MFIVKTRLMKTLFTLLFISAIILSSCTKEELKSYNGTYSGIKTDPLWDSNGRAGADTTYDITFTIEFKNNSKVKVNGNKYKFEDNRIKDPETNKRYTSSGYFFADDSLVWHSGGLISSTFYLKKD